MRISALQRLAQSAEAREDPLVAGMVESLMTQLKRAVANRDAGLLEAADTEARLEPDQVVVRGESDGCSRVVFRLLLVCLARCAISGKCGPEPKLTDARCRRILRRRSRDGRRRGEVV